MHPVREMYQECIRFDGAAALPKSVVDCLVGLYDEILLAQPNINHLVQSLPRPPAEGMVKPVLDNSPPLLQWLEMCSTESREFFYEDKIYTLDIGHLAWFWCRLYRAWSENM